MRKALSLFVLGAYLTLSNHCGVMALTVAKESSSSPCHGASEKNHSQDSKNPCGDQFSCCTRVNHVLVAGVFVDPMPEMAGELLPSSPFLFTESPPRVWSRDAGPPGRSSVDLSASLPSRAPPLA